MIIYESSCLMVCVCTVCFNLSDGTKRGGFTVKKGKEDSFISLFFLIMDLRWRVVSRVLALMQTSNVLYSLRQPGGNLISKGKKTHGSLRKDLVLFVIFCVL